MKSAEEFIGEIETLRGRIASLSAAILRISASLDVDTVLNEIAQAARALTGARYAVITAVDDAGELEDFVMSGLAPDERQRLLEWPEAMQVFEHLRDLPSPVRVPDMPGYVRALGFSADPLFIRSFQGAPMRHRDIQVGNFFLGEKEGGREFTDEDEELLVLFAAQAATAIANARTHRDEQRARSDLAALVDTSPVGVVVFDARTGHPAFLNQETRRILEGLLIPGQAPEELAKVLRCRLSDGREIDLHEFPLVEALEQCRDDAGRGDRALGRRRAAGHDPGQRHADPLCRRCGRVGGGYHSGHGAARGAGAAAGRVPGHGEPRAAGAADLDQGLDHHCAGRLAGPGAGRGASVLPHHRRAGRPHGRPDQRPSRCGAPRHGHSVGRTRARAGGRPGGPGAQHVPLRRRPAHPPHRPAAGAAPGDGRRAAHRPGSEQPLFQCREILCGVLPHPGRGGARRRSRRDLGLRRGPGGAAGAPPAPVPQVCRRRRWEARGRGGRTGARHLQGAGGGPWGPHLGDERRAGPGHTVHLHAPGGRGGCRQGPGRAPPEPFRRAPWNGEEQHAHPCRGRRSADPSLRPRRARGGGLRRAGDGRPPGNLQASSGRRNLTWSCST